MQRQIQELVSGFVLRVLIDTRAVHFTPEANKELFQVLIGTHHNNAQVERVCEWVMLRA
jgi:hypothetical protein